MKKDKGIQVTPVYSHIPPSIYVKAEDKKISRTLPDRGNLCGSTSGYRVHLRKKEKTCFKCRMAMNASQKQSRINKNLRIKKLRLENIRLKNNKVS